MRTVLFVISSLLLSISAFAQNDTINQVDENGRKQGHWIYYGKDRPDYGYPLDGKVEEGYYKDDRKEGIWTKYHNDGKTPKLKGEYHNNRPSGRYWKISPEGFVFEKGRFRGMHYKGIDTTFRFNESQQLTNYSIYKGRILYLDSSFYYLNSGCLDSVVVSDLRDSSVSVLQFSNEICDSLMSNTKRLLSYSHYDVDTINGRIIERSVCDWRTKGSASLRRGQVYDWEGKPIVPHVPNDAVDESSIQPIYRVDKNSLENGPAYLLEIHVDGDDTIEFAHQIRTAGRKLVPTGYNAILNGYDEIFLDSEFKNYQLWDGKVYEYDDDGILLKVKVYRKGQYHSGGQL